MATVHNACRINTLFHRGNQGVEEVIVTNLTGGCIVKWDKSFVVPILLVAIIIFKLSTVTLASSSAVCQC
jgi:hypothetical protein